MAAISPTMTGIQLFMAALPAVPHCGSPLDGI
jgi:hypothetical protein